ncbi:MAG: T9SS type A sorting domain-containing protein [Flavobacterium sp.]
MKPISKYNLKKILILYSCFYFLSTTAQTVTTLAGSTSGFADGIGTAAKFNGSAGVAVDTDGTLYVADRINHRIRKITTTGLVSTLAGATQGFADGTGTAALFSYPMNLTVDVAGNVFVADSNNHRIRKITAAGVVTTVAGSTQGYLDGTRNAAQFDHPEGVAVDAAGNIFVGDTGNQRIRKITAAGVVTTLAGSGTFGFADGIGTLAQFWSPSGIAVDAAGNVFVAEKQNNRIRKITAAGLVTTLAGNSTSGFADGIGTAAKFNTPFSVAVDASGNVFVADSANNRIRKITAAGMVTTLAGSTQGYLDGIGTTAKFYYPIGVSVATDGTVFVGESGNSRIRKITTILSTDSFQLENQISVYPNPASSLINLELENLTADKITLFNLNGSAFQFEHSINNKTEIYIGNLANGIYVMQIITDKGTVYKKIVKE